MTLARRSPHPVLLYGALLLHTFLSAGTYLVAKRAMREIPPLTLGLLRFAVASVLLALLLRGLLRRGARLPPPAQRKKLLALAFIAVPLNQGFFLVGLSRSTASHAALLYSLTPVFVLLLAQALLRELPGARTVVGTLLALGGTVFVLLQRGVDPYTGAVGDLLLFVAVLAWACYTAGGRPLVAAHGALPVTAWSHIGGTILYLPVGLFALFAGGGSEQVARASPGAWTGVLYLSVVTSVIAYLLWYWALAHLAAARVAVFSNLQPLATATLAHFFLREHVTASFVAGALVVMTGVVLAQTGREVQEPAAVPPEP